MGSVTPDPASDPAREGPPAPDPGRAVLLGRGLGRRLPDGERRWIWRGLDLGLGPGELVTARGATGSGKTLLLRTLAGLDPVQEGRLELLGRPHRAWTPAGWRRRVVYLHQDPVLFPGTVEENLREPFGWGIHGDRRFDREAIRARLEPLGLDPGWLARDAGGLSGGERQLLALLRALQLDPSALLLDEPTAALDPAATRRVETLVADWLEGAGEDRAVLWVTHDREQARRMGRRRLVLERGRLGPDRDGGDG